MAAESALDLAPAQRKRTVWRLDGGAGSDDQMRWLLGRGYHLLAKGISHRRAKALAPQVKRWDAYGHDCWLGEVLPPVDLGRPVRVFVKQRLKEQQPVYSYYVCTLSLPSKGRFLALYDQRGSAEIEQFRNDKSGLGLEARRKWSFGGQQTFLLLTDLAHNLLAHFYHQALAESPFAAYGPKRIVRDLFNLPGRLVFDQNRLVRVDLLSQTQFSSDLVRCLKHYWLSGNP